MNLYTCEKCNKEFNQKCHYMNHLLKKNPCDIKLTNNKVYNCEYCNHLFIRSRNMTRHLKICKMKGNLKNLDDSKNKNKNNNIEDNIEKIKNDNQELKKELQDIKNLMLNNKIQSSNENVVNIENQTVNIKPTTIINNIYIMNYKDEKLDDNDLKSILNSNDPILHAVEKIHCNENKPEQHNVLIKDKTRNNIYVYENNKWNIQNKSQTLANIYSSTINKITNTITDNEYDILEVVNADIPENYNNVKTDNFINERNYFYKNIKNIKKTTTKMNDILYNNKKMIIESKNKNEVAIKRKNRQINEFNNLNKN